MPMLSWDSLYYVFIGTCFLQFVLWLYQYKKQKADIVDAGWAFSVGALAIFAGITGDGDHTRRLLICLIAGIWSARLSSYLLANRVLKNGEEDGRYRELRASWGKASNIKFFIFFQLQAILSIFLSLPFFLASSNHEPISLIAILLTVALGLISIVGEAISDHQLKIFKSNPSNRGKVCNIGLWRYSRHPNYFFEWIHWLAYPILAFGAQYWYFSLISPILILFLILKVTGIPPTEARAINSKGELYKEYQRSTNAFFPWVTKKSKI